MKEQEKKRYGRKSGFKKLSLRSKNKHTNVENPITLFLEGLAYAKNDLLEVVIKWLNQERR